MSTKKIKDMRAQGWKRDEIRQDLYYRNNGVALQRGLVLRAIFWLARLFSFQRR